MHEGWGLGVALRSARPPLPNPGCKPRNFTPHACPPAPLQSDGVLSEVLGEPLDSLHSSPFPYPPPVFLSMPRDER